MNERLELTFAREQVSALLRSGQQRFIPAIGDKSQLAEEEAKLTEVHRGILGAARSCPC